METAARETGVGARGVAKGAGDEGGDRSVATRGGPTGPARPGGIYKFLKLINT